jgi:pyruvate dehydrogenase E2 component (dihydrolipoamide acetyltransferase)
MTDFVMPSLGADMDEGTLVEWLVAPGDVVKHGQVVAVVDTVKAAIEVEVFVDGVVEALLVSPGTTVAVGTPLARLAADAEPKPRRSAAEGTSAEGVPPTVQGSRAAVSSPIVRHLAHERGVDVDRLTGSGSRGEVTRSDVLAATRAPTAAERVKASPLARRRADELGVDLASVPGSGPDGVISVADVDRVAPVPTRVALSVEPVREEPAAGAAHKQQAMREAIGALMARGKREIPHYYLRTTIDLARPLAWLRERNAERGVEDRAVPAVLLLKAAALAAREVPEVNGYYTDGRFEPGEHVHLGVAVSLRGGGLVAPAIHDADRLDLAQLMKALKDLVARARSGRLRASQMSDPTITVTNLGDQGVEEVQGVIYPPQVALVGFGKVVERPWAVDGLLGVHPLVVATLAADHRVTDGHRGGQYLNAVESLLQMPERLDTAAAPESVT